MKFAVVLGTTTVFLSAAELRAERVGFSFQGALIQSGSAGTYTLFSTSVPKTSPISGTFSYDTTTPGVDIETGVRSYHQLIHGGYTLDINNGAVQLSASDYKINVANDYGLPALDAFIVDYTYDSVGIPPLTPEPILKNGAPWTGTKAQVFLQMNWTPETFGDPDEPKLTLDRPNTAGYSVCSFCADVASSSTPRFFSVSSITRIIPLPGDYNVNGKFDSGDYAEWRKAFGESQPQALFADGDNDGVVDMADYVVWRKAMTTAGAGATFGSVIPEPVGLLLAGTAGVVFFAIGRRNMMRIPLLAEQETRRQPQRAGTLVEVMVVMAIIGTLASLILPAVQGARESARANSCRNNLKQIGLALLNYESTHKHFPMGAEGRFDLKVSPVPFFGLSWWPDVLPHLEEGAVAERLDRKGPYTGWVQLNPHNGEVVDGFAPAFFFCPSSSVPRFAIDEGYQVAAPSYVGISGATNHDGFPEVRVSPACCFDGQISAGGVLTPNKMIRARRVTDGLANTLFVGEQSDLAYSEKFGTTKRIDGGCYRGWISGTNMLGVPPTSGTALSLTYNLTTMRYKLNERRYDLPGIFYDRGANNPLLSPHPGIVHLLHCDGSVHAGADSMDIVVVKSLATRDEGIERSE
jgi:type II secretory pathway pseudopilin PulG